MCLAISFFASYPFHMLSASTQAFLDGLSVPVVFDSDSPTSSCPPTWICGLPSHIRCVHPDGFSYSALLHLLLSLNVGCLILGRDWLNSEYVAHHHGMFFTSLYSFLDHNPVLTPSHASSCNDVIDFSTFHWLAAEAVDPTLSAVVSPSLSHSPSNFHSFRTSDLTVDVSVSIFTTTLSVLVVSVSVPLVFQLTHLFWIVSCICTVGMSLLLVLSRKFNTPFCIIWFVATVFVVLH